MSTHMSDKQDQTVPRLPVSSYSSTYRVVKHNGGWAYETDGTRSELFRTRDAARKAARLAAAEHARADETAPRPSERNEAQWYDDSG
jgi:Uncharacterized protein conserved in bacteria (DUF2188)